ncbi:MAG: GAF domain-containing protein [Pseudomonadota bacterium]
MADLITPFAARIADAQPDEVFTALHQLCDETVGVKLFTCSRFDMTAMQAERIHTSDQQAYPLTGLKDIVPNRWTAIVLDGRKPFLADSIEELRDVFPDNDKIEALGLGAAINIPVFVGGNVLGTVNLLEVDHGYSHQSMSFMPELSVCATLSFLVYLHVRQTGRLERLSSD